MERQFLPPKSERHPQERPVGDMKCDLGSRGSEEAFLGIARDDGEECDSG
jgi:hypothetical protein